MKRFLIVILCLLSLSGCAPYGPEELDRLTKEDPRFKQMILTRDQIHAQIHAIKDDLLAKKKAMDAEISRFRREYDAYSKAQNLKIEKYEAAIEANRNTLKREIDTASAQLAAKVAELEGYQKTTVDVKKVLEESKGLRISAEEKQKWEERLLMLSEKMRPLADELQELKLEMRLKKRKIGFLK